MIARTWREDLKRKQGEQVYLSALRDYATGAFGAPSRGPLIAQVLSVLVVASPFVVCALGLILIVTTLPSWGGAFFGAVLIGAGYFLCPARYRLPKGALTRADAPGFFAQLDEVSAALNAPAITHVVVTDDFNAFVTREGQKTVLGIGALLWDAVPGDQKVALVAHEIAHLVNNDPARGKRMRYALDTLARWDDLVAPDWDGNVFADIALLPFRLLIAALEQALLRPMFLQSQRAEYLADALAAEVAGADAISRLLITLSLGEGLVQEWKGLHGLGDASGRDVIERLVACLHQMDPERRRNLLTRADAEKLSIDATHPPSAYRKGFVETVARDAARLRPGLFDQEDAAFAGRFHAIGEQLAVHFDTQ
ncbi:MAG: M48 family metallopeptidase [Pseudomonadota bacterium]